jgi:hypothetical protein
LILAVAMFAASAVAAATALAQALPPLPVGGPAKPTHVVRILGCGTQIAGVEGTAVVAKQLSLANEATEQWHMMPLGNGYNRFRHINSGLFLDAHEVPGFLAFAAPSQPSTRQLWHVGGPGGGRDFIRQASNGRYLSCERVQLETALFGQGTFNQEWKIVVLRTLQVGAEPPGPTPNPDDVPGIIDPGPFLGCLDRCLFRLKRCVRPDVTVDGCVRRYKYCQAGCGLR